MGATPHPPPLGSLVQGELSAQLTEGLSVRFFPKKSLVKSLPISSTIFLSPPSRSARHLPFVKKGRHEVRGAAPLHSGAKSKGDKVLRRIFAFRPFQANPSPVKTRRYKQDAKDKAFRRGAYSYVRDPRKTQSDNVLRRIFAFRPFQANPSPVKTHKCKQSAKAAEV